MSAVTFVGGRAVSSHDVCVFGHLRFWAERGLIHVEDERDNSYKSYSVGTILRRMKGISDMLGNSTDRQKHSHDQLDNVFREKNQAMLDAMVAICAKAQGQGMPSDASARRDKVRRRAKTVVVPGRNDSL
jgi:DNA-binding transcriptional MerR regulator